MKKTIAILLILVQILMFPTVILATTTDTTTSTEVSQVSGPTQYKTAMAITSTTTAQAIQIGEISTVVGSVGYGQATALGQFPLGVATYGSYIYVADGSYGVVRRIDKATGNETVVAGGGGDEADDVPALQALISPIDVVADNNGNLYIAEGRNRVREIAASDHTQFGIAMTAGNIYTIAGNGIDGYSGDNGPASDAAVSFSLGIGRLAVDGAGNLFIARNNRIREVAANDHTQFGITMTAGYIYSVAGNGTWGYSGDGGIASSAQIFDSRGVAVDGNGNLFISDGGNNRVREVAATNGSQFGIAMTAGNIYTVAGTGTGGFSGDNSLASSAKLYQPEGLAVDSSGNLFIADTQNNRVREVAATNGTQFGIAMTAGNIYSVAGNGTGAYSGDNGLATSGQLSSPRAITVDSNGNLYIEDYFNYRIREVAAITGTQFGIATIAGNIYSVAGNGTLGFSGDNGNVYVVDYHRVREIAASDHTQFGIAMTAGNIYTVAGNGIQGYSGDNGPAMGAQLNHTYGVAVDGKGNLFISESNRIREVAAVNGTQFGKTMAAGNIYTVAGNGTSGYSGDNGPATSAKLDPFGVAVDRSGNIFIADYNNNRIREVAATNGIQFGIAMTTGNIYTVVGNGISGFSGDNGPAPSAQIKYPRGVAVDSSGNLFIADTFNNRIREVAATNDTQFGIAMTAGNIYSVAGSGIQGYSGDNGLASSAKLNRPEGVAVDSSGNLFIADSFNERIREVAAIDGTQFGIAMTTGNIYSMAGNGLRGYSGDNGPAASAQLNYPSGVVVHIGNLYISDSGNNVIRFINAGIAAPDAPTGITAAISGDRAIVSFTPPLVNGGSPITSYTVTTSPAAITVKGSSSPISVSGLDYGQSYTFTVTATNAAGAGPASVESNSITLTTPAGGTSSGKHSDPQPTPDPPVNSTVPRTTVEERIGGLDRYETAVKIAQNYFTTGADTVVLTRGDISADALTAVPLAKHFNAPLLLTPQDQLPDQVINEIKTLGVKTVYIVGGETAVSRQVADVITGQGIKIQRVAGLDRYATCYEVAKLIGHTGQAVIVNGNDYAYPDALSISSWAAYNGVPILYADGTDQLPEVTAKALMELKVSRTILVGGTAVLPKSLEGLVPNPERYAGIDRYDTNAQVLSKLQPNPEQIFAATGNNFADALAGGVVAGQSNSWLLLTGAVGDSIDGLATEQQELLKSAKGSVLDLHVFGGTVVVPDSTLKYMKSLLGH